MRGDHGPSTRLGLHIFRFLFVVLVLVRVPSIAEPAGADQSLYSYVGQRILHGEWPYRDAWDQKPPAIHATYAAVLALWPDMTAINALDIGVAIATALCLLSLGRALGELTGAGELSALLFLFLSNPAFGRLGGVRVRSQCEVFIGLAVAAALVLVWRTQRTAADAVEPPRTIHAGAFGAGALLGVAILYKYNAVAYALPCAAAVYAWRPSYAGHGRDAIRRLAFMALGTTVVVAGVVLAFAAAGVGGDLYEATVTYNMRYSGETYRGAAHALRNLLSFPVEHARVDSLWWLGGLGTAALLVMSLVRPAVLVVPLWVGAAIVSIAINGSRGLPQYFLQAGPPLALAAGLLVALLWNRSAMLGRVLLIALVATGVWRVTNIPKAVDYARFDLAWLTGRMDRTTYLLRFGEVGTDQKYSALAVDHLAETLRRTTAPNDRVLLFGFSQGALVASGRASASRFFWSRPVIVGFNEGRRGYGVPALLDELERSKPRTVVLQVNDWQDSSDSYSFFLGNPQLAEWLGRAYTKTGEQDNFVLWQRVSS